MTHFEKKKLPAYLGPNQQNFICTSARGETFYGTSYFSKKCSFGHKSILLASHFHILPIDGGY
jgi:hypothetical protein